MFKALLLVISTTGEGSVYSHPGLFMTREDCERVAAADAPAAIIALGGVAGQWTCVPAGDLV